jgi:dTDP-4-dehydrorhamnose reductase
MSTILVAGRDGQLACCLQAHAKAAGLRLLTAGRPEFDFEEPASLERFVAGRRLSAIINTAAYTAVDQAEAEPGRAFAVNRDGAARLAAIAARLQVPFVHLSTDYVFSGEKQSPYTEDDATSPLSVYGQSKLAGEVAVLEAHPEALVIRTSWAYSPYGHNFVKTMLRLAATKPIVRVVGDQVGTPTSAEDLGGAILEIVQQLVSGRHLQGSRIYHLAAPDETTWHGFAAAVFKALSRHGGRTPSLQEITTADYPTAARRPANSRLDSSKVERVFGIRLPPWRSSLESCIDQLLTEQIQI